MGILSRQLIRFRAATSVPEMQPLPVMRGLLVWKQAVKPRPMSAPRALVPAGTLQRLEESLSLVAINEQALAAALERRDMEAALAAVSFELQEESLQHALRLLIMGQIETAGRAALRALKHLQKQIIEPSFDLTNPRATEFARVESGKLITNISGETRGVIRQTLGRAFTEGRTVDQVAREIREVVGLLPRQATAVENFSARLVEEGVAGPRLAELRERYAARLLNQRARMIARTEIGQASIFGQQELWRQAVEGRWIAADSEREWIITEDELLAVVGPRTKVLTRDGWKPIAQMRVGDHVLTHKDRFCRVTRAEAKRYDGPSVKIHFASKEIPRVHVTYGHPVLIARNGQCFWVLAENLRNTDKIFVSGIPCAGCGAILPKGPRSRGLLYHKCNSRQQNANPEMRRRQLAAIRRFNQQRWSDPAERVKQSKRQHDFMASPAGAQSIRRALNREIRADIGVIGDPIRAACCLLEMPIKRLEHRMIRCQTVYHLTVEEDESFIAGGVVVHNCPMCSPRADMRAKLGQPYADGVIGPPLHPNCLTGDCLITASPRIAAVSERWYDGDVLIVRTAAGKQFTLTPNHLILTPSGWRAAALLDIGSDIVCQPRIYGMRFDDDDDENIPATIAEIANAARRSGKMAATKVPVFAPDFHGDGKGSEIAIVWADGLSRYADDATSAQQIEELALIGSHASSGLNRLGLKQQTEHLFRSAARSFVGGSNLPIPGSGVHHRPLQFRSFGSGSQPNASLTQKMLDSSATDFEAMREFQARFASNIELDTIIEIECHAHHGFVYNLQTAEGWYAVNDIITHNCRCAEVLVSAEAP